MINIGTETLLTPTGAARMLPTRRKGRPVHVSTIHRWMSSGVNGVRLDAIKIGGALHTSVEALQRFADELTSQERQAEAPLNRNTDNDVEAQLAAEGL